MPSTSPMAIDTDRLSATAHSPHAHHPMLTKPLLSSPHTHLLSSSPSASPHSLTAPYNHSQPGSPHFNHSSSLSASLTSSSSASHSYPLASAPATPSLLTSSSASASSSSVPMLLTPAPESSPSSHSAYSLSSSLCSSSSSPSARAPLPPPPVQLAQFSAVFDMRLRIDHAYNVISATWFRVWCEHVGYQYDRDADVKSGGVQPAAIDNSSLLATAAPYLQLHAALQEQVEFYLLNAAAYSLLHQWYSGGPTITRYAITLGQHRHCVIELYPIHVLVRRQWPAAHTSEAEAEGSGSADHEQHKQQQRPVVMTFSRERTLQNVIDAMRTDSNDLRPGRLWQRINPHSKHALAHPPHTRSSHLLSSLSSSASPAVHKLQNGTSHAHSSPAASAVTNGVSHAASAVQGAWQVIPSADYSHTLESAEWQSGTEVLVEYRSGDVWAWSGGKRSGWVVGDAIDACDPKGKWYEARLMEVNGSQGHVHFEGWNHKWDQWIDMDSDRIAPVSTHTTGPHVSSSIPSHRFPSHASASSSSFSHAATTDRGSVGLRNLGNSCFLNSTLQCLMQTPGITEFFLARQHIKHLNRDNPLGWKGRIAEEYGYLIAEVWSGQKAVVSPKPLKQVIGEFQPRFSGYQQHDSSELLACILDGLHEDLNLVRHKPLTQTVDSDGRPDAVVANEAWARHLQRNQSLIVDRCQGQLKSKVVCPECDRVSITFDPFLMLSLPLPNNRFTYVKVTFIPSDSTARLLYLPFDKPTPFFLTVKLAKGCSVADLKQAMNTQLGLKLSLSQLFVTEVWTSRLQNMYNDDQPIDSIKPTQQLVVYDLPPLIDHVSRQPEKWTSFELAFLTTANTYTTTALAMHATDHHLRLHHSRFEFIGVPLVLQLPTHLVPVLPLTQLQQFVHDTLAPLVTDRCTPADYSICIFNPHLTTLLLDVSAELNPTTPSNNNANASTTTRTINLIELSRPYGGLLLTCIWPTDSLTKLATPSSFTTHPSSLSAPSAASTSSASSSSKSPSMQLTDCLSSFVKEEVLRSSEKWYCSHCQQHQCASKKLDVWRTPDILILHLKRFHYTHAVREKIDTYVDFPIHGLDMTQWCISASSSRSEVTTTNGNGNGTAPASASSPSLLYDLYGVSNHYGGLGAGHYTAYVQNLTNKQWYSLDDEHVTAIDPKAIKTHHAYVLFYQRRHTQQAPPPPLSHQHLQHRHLHNKTALHANTNNHTSAL